MKDFAGRIAVITGGGTGMGRELARQLVAEGCNVAMCDVSAENLAEKAFTILDAVYRDTFGNHLRLDRVRLYETPNCWADAIRNPNDN